MRFLGYILIYLSALTGMLIPMVFVIGVGFLDCDTAALAIVFLTLQEGFNAAYRAGHPISRVDIAPQ